MVDKKKRPIVSRGSMVFIPVGVAGCVFDNAELLLNLLDKWQVDNPKKKIVGTPIFNITPSSSGRGVTIDCITFTWKINNET